MAWLESMIRLESQFLVTRGLLSWIHLAIISIPVRKQMSARREGIEGIGRLSSRYPSAVELVLWLPSFNSWWCICVKKNCQMINTVVQEVMSRNQSLLVVQVLRSGKICTCQESNNPAKVKIYHSRCNRWSCIGPHTMGVRRIFSR